MKNDSQNEIYQLRKELMSLKEKLQEVSNLNSALKSELCACRKVIYETFELGLKQRDFYEGEASKVEAVKKNQIAWIEAERKRAREEIKEQYDQKLKEEIAQYKEENAKIYNELSSLKRELKKKESLIESLSKENSGTVKRPFSNSMKQDVFERDSSIQTYKDRLSETEEKMRSVFAENSILRRLAQVPDSYGFNVEEVKIAERHQIEDYKRKVWNLEREVEELEAERVQLRNKLRVLSNHSERDMSSSHHSQINLPPE